LDLRLPDRSLRARNSWCKQLLAAVEEVIE
jgi:hypothetical protein